MTLQQEALHAVRLLPEEKLPVLIALVRSLSHVDSSECAAVPATIPPLAFGALSKQQRDAEIQKGFDDLDTGRILSAEEVEDAMAREFGIGKGPSYDSPG